MVSHPMQDFADEAYKDEDTLRYLYHEQEMSLNDIATEFGMTIGGINYWMEKHGIAKRSPPGRTGVRFFTNRRGYELWRTEIWEDGERYSPGVFVHKLVLVAEHGVDALRGMQVHHRNHIPWDNRPDNLELLTPEQHHLHHEYAEAFGDIPVRK